MSWTLITIRDAEDTEDASMYPIAGEKPDSIELEPEDGNEVATTSVQGLKVLEHQSDLNRWDTLLSVDDIAATLYVTDSRVAICCSKYDKGGGWIGNPATMVVFNAVSKARAASRRRGKILVGHVRYPWLASVGGSPKHGWGTYERVMLRTKDRATGSPLALELTLAKPTSSLRLADEVARRAARFRLRTEPKADEKARSTWTDLLEPPELQPAKGKYASHTLGSYWSAQPSHAYGPPGTSA